MYKIIFGTIFALFCINLTACSESGCPEGQREYAGNCVDINDGDEIDGDYPLVFPDGDNGGGGDDNPVIDGDQEENTITGSGRCGSPFVHNVSDRSTPLNGHGDISLMSAIISGQSCKPLGGTDEDSLGLGPEVVVKIFLYPSDTITLSFNGDGFDAIMYVLLGACADSDQTNCGLQTINQFGMGQGEQVVFSPPAQGEYFVVMDTLATSATGAYYYKIEIAEGVDGDQDQVDGDTDGDTTDTDTTDSESDTVSETDTEQTEADKEEASVPEFYNVIVGGYSIPDDENVTGNFSDLYWQGSQVHLMADTGLAYWTYVSNNFDGDPTFTETPDKVIKGVSYRSAIRAELDQTIRLIGPTAHGNIQFPSNFSPKASGLAYYNEEYYALDQENNRIFIYSHNGTNWDHRTITLYWFSNLEGITITADGKMYLLDVDDLSAGNPSSHIHLARIDDGTTRAIYHVEGQLLSGISWDQANGIMWATMKNLRRISKLNPFVSVD